jgi:WD40 repeat protein
VGRTDLILPIAPAFRVSIHLYLFHCFSRKILFFLSLFLHFPLHPSRFIHNTLTIDSRKEGEKKRGMDAAESLFKMKVAAKRQQDKDRIAFSVVVGMGVADGNSDFQMAEIGGRERASTGLLKVGGDVLSFISTFLSWEKVNLQHEWKVPGGYVNACHISPCNRMILTCSGNDLHLWDAASGMLKSTFEGHTGRVHSCRFFSDGKTVVSSSDDDTLNVWDIASGSLVRTQVGHRDMVRCVDVSPDDKRILSTSWDNTWKLWNSRTGELQHTEQMDSLSCCCSFSPNGSLLLVGSGRSLRLHDSTTYQLQHTLTGHSEMVMCCSFAPDGITIVSGSNDHTLKLWSTTTGQCLRTLAGHSGSVRSCSFSPSGLAIYSASHDKTLVMWTAATGKLDGIIDADPASQPESMCASSDGQYLVSGHNWGYDGTMKMWCVACEGFAK